MALPLWTLLPTFCVALCLSSNARANSINFGADDTSVSSGQISEHEAPDEIVVDEFADTHSDGNVHYELDWDEHGASSDAHGGFHHRPDSHAPAGLSADHAHKRGKWMVEYKFAYMNMQGMRRGTQSISPAQAAAGAGTAVSPQDMNMMMHMGHVMYGLTDNVTVYAMFMWTELAMDHQLFPQGAPAPMIPFRTENADFDDLRVGAVLNLYNGCNTEWIGHIGFSLPTGDISQRVTTGPPPPPNSLFPYPMRTGAGTVNIRPGLTYKKWNECGSIGIQVMGNIPLHKNYRDYAQGAEAQASFWISRLLSESTSASFRVEGFWRDDIRGADPDLPVALVTANNPNYQGRSNLNLYGGLNTVRCGHRFAIEVGTPVYQQVQGFQLEQDLYLFSSWSKAF